MAPGRLVTTARRLVPWAWASHLTTTQRCTNRVGKNYISNIRDLTVNSEYTHVMEYGYAATGGQGFDDSYLESGDSGGPSFAVVNGSLALLGTHFVNSGAVYNGAVSGDSFLPYYVNQLDANMVGASVAIVGAKLTGIADRGRPGCPGDGEDFAGDLGNRCCLAAACLPKRGRCGQCPVDHLGHDLL